MFNRTQKTIIIKTTDKLDRIKIKKRLLIKRYHEESEKANHRLGAMFAMHIHEEFKNVKKKKRGWAQDLNGRCMKVDLQMANKPMKSCYFLRVVLISILLSRLRLKLSLFV